MLTYVVFAHSYTSQHGIKTIMGTYMAACPRTKATGHVTCAMTHELKKYFRNLDRATS